MDFLNSLIRFSKSHNYLMGKLKLWATEEDQILVRISTATKSKKWKKASLELKKYGYERTDVECRQRYINHLDPSVNKKLWTEQELETLYSKYKQYGNKWFLIQKHLPGRTQTKIKNYFYGNIRYLLKVIIKYFMKGSTGFINDINTETLVNIYESQSQYEDYQIICKTIKRLKYSVEKEKCLEIINENQEQFYQFIQFFLEKSNIKSALYLQSQSSSVQESGNQSSLLIVKCQPLNDNKLQIINPFEERTESTASKMQHLKSMAFNHFKLYQHYQSAYMKLMEKESQ